MKSLKIKLYDKLTIDLFYNAFIRASKNKKYKKEVLLFELDLESNLYDLIEQIKTKNYCLGRYTSFIIYEPKKRIIKKLPFKDRIVQQWYIEEFIKNYYTKRFINDSYACLENKGVHKCIVKLKRLIRKDDYVLKMDISKFFDSVDIDILKELLFKKINDNNLRNFTELLIRNNKGLPIGNYTSQWFGNIYLNELDYYVKHYLKIKRYIRYLDDFCILVKSKEEAKIVYKKIEIFLNEKLHLKLNPKSKYFPIKNGIDFCGYIIYPTYILVRKRNLKKINKNNINRYYGYLKWCSTNIYNIYK